MFGCLQSLTMVSSLGNVGNPKEDNSGQTKKSRKRRDAFKDRQPGSPVTNYWEHSRGDRTIPACNLAAANVPTFKKDGFVISPGFCCLKKNFAKVRTESCLIGPEWFYGNTALDLPNSNLISDSEKTQTCSPLKPWQQWLLPVHRGLWNLGWG